MLIFKNKMVLINILLLMDVKYKRDNYNYNDACHVESTPLSDMFFSDENVKTLMIALRKAVYLYSEKNTGLKIDIGDNTQEKNELISVMGTVLDYYRIRAEGYGNLYEKLRFLDKEVIDHITPKITGKVISYLRYLRDFDEPYNVMPNPINTKLSQRELKLSSYYNDCKR